MWQNINRFVKQFNPGIEGERKQVTTAMSSAGLIYKYFGREIVKTISQNVYNKDLNDDMVELVYEKLYTSLIMEIDAIDNGVDQFKGKSEFNIGTHLSSRVKFTNMSGDYPKDDERYSQHNAFKKAMKMCEQEFMAKMYGRVVVMLPSREIVEKAINERANFH